jgi:hypothetical protein
MAQNASQEQQAGAGQLQEAACGLDGDIALSHVTSRLHILQNYKNKYDIHFTMGTG